MSYTRETLATVERILEERRQQAELRQLDRSEEVLAKIPAVSQLQRELAGTIADVVRNIGSADIKDIVREVSEKNLAIQKKIGDLLEENGFDRDYLETEYTCPACRDTGYISGESCECRLALLKEVALGNLRSNSPVGKATFENFRLDYYPDEADPALGVNPRARMEQVFNFCKNYAEDFSLDSDSLYLWGNTGLGKTHLASAIAGEVAKNGFQVIFDSASNLMRRLEKEHFSSARDTTYDGAQDELIKCDLLIIDDFGTEFLTQFTVSAVYNVINSRLNRNLPVIINSNLDIEGVEKAYSQRIASRIIGNYKYIQFFGSDIRQIKKNF